jgi:hypothetical protein
MDCEGLDRRSGAQELDGVIPSTPQNPFSFDLGFVDPIGEVVRESLN